MTEDMQLEKEAALTSLGAHSRVLLHCCGGMHMACWNDRVSGLSHAPPCPENALQACIFMQHRRWRRRQGSAGTARGAQPHI